MSRFDLAHFFTLLTREELKTVFALVHLSRFDEYRDGYAIDRFATPGREGRTDSIIELFRRAIRYLHVEAGIDFQGIRVHPDGSLIGYRVAEPRNHVYARPGMVENELMDPLDAVQTAIRLLAPIGVNVTPLREAEHEMKTSIEEGVKLLETQLAMSGSIQ